jgi:rRNA small subunit aminocarboxypropyltransferase
MRSSGSTPSRSTDPAIPLFLWIVGDDHPRACTGRRLVRRGLVHPLDARHPAPRGLLLDPHAETPLSPADRPAGARGLSAVDCSWNRLSARGGYPSGPLDSVRPDHRRRLPWLRAGNAQHFGHLGELNTAEALAAALTILGERDRAQALLDAIGAGRSFLDLNTAWLTGYAAQPNAAAVRRLEVSLLSG